VVGNDQGICLIFAEALEIPGQGPGLIKCVGLACAARNGNGCNIHAVLLGQTAYRIMLRDDNKSLDL